MEMWKKHMLGPRIVDSIQSVKDFTNVRIKAQKNFIYFSNEERVRYHRYSHVVRELMGALKGFILRMEWGRKWVVAGSFDR
jgi:hypothetical protein